MCSQVDVDYFTTVHHEMGHVEYFMQYRHQPALFRSGANAAFHEAVGDTIAISVLTYEHLRAIGLVNQPVTTSTSKAASRREYKRRINSLLKTALNKVAFLPFAYVVEKWRYRVFRGDIKPDDYNTEWWKLRREYQGIAAPVSRQAGDFDPGSKYHIPSNVPYTRYFLSFLGQFQFYEALCKAANHKGPLQTCDFYRSSPAGRLFRSVLSAGASVPWPDLMSKFTGIREFSTDAILNYFKPLIDWLERENRGHHVGW
jgi:peptidyl-dipeptidase A